MEARNASLMDLLGGPSRFRVPIYQRTYSWGPRECEQLWHDVLAAADETAPKHFIGSVVYVADGQFHATAVPELLVVDGQQRITTFLLTITALSQAIDAGEVEGRVAADSLRARYLRTHDGGPKLVLSADDAGTFQALVDGRAPIEPVSRAVVEACERLAGWIERCGRTSDEILEGLTKLVVVDVSLDRRADNPQLVFESLNSKGVELTSFDLVRNYVLMGLDPDRQDALYKRHWHPLERALGGDAGTFESFLRGWLSLKLGDRPKRKEIYETFKRLKTEHGGTVEELVEELHRHARFYAQVVLGAEAEPALARAFASLAELGIEAPVPLLLALCDLHARRQLTTGEFAQACAAIESWLFRRAVCDVPSNVLGRAFAVMSGKLDEDSVIDSLCARLLLGVRRLVFPSDAEFEQALCERNMYRFGLQRYLLERIENHDRKEPVPVAEYTLEHVMPQNPDVSRAWREMLGEDWKRVQEQWLHTLGNLTFTGYNSELSDRPFADKLAMKGGFKDSPLRLNAALASLDSWDEAAIVTRGRELARKAVAIWPRPEVAADVLDRYRLRKPTATRQHEGVEHFDMSASILELYDAFERGLTELGLEPIIWKNKITVRRTARDTFLWVFPRKRWLGVEVLAPPEPVGLPTFAEETEWRGDPYIVAKARTLAQIDTTLEMISAILDQDPTEA